MSNISFELSQRRTATGIREIAFEGSSEIYKNILVTTAMDHLRDTWAAIKIARSLAADGASITALSIMDEIPVHVTAYLPDDHGRTLLAEAETSLKAELAGVKDVKTVAASGNPGRKIIDFAADHDIDCMMIASHRPGL